MQFKNVNIRLSFRHDEIQLLPDWFTSDSREWASKYDKTIGKGFSFFFLGFALRVFREYPNPIYKPKKVKK